MFRAPLLIRAVLLGSLAGLCVLASGSPSAAETPAGKDGWRSLFDGRTLGQWKRTEFKEGGAVTVQPDFRGAPAIVVEAGKYLSGLHWSGDVPKTNYEVTLEALKIKGSDFLCGLTFPVDDSHATLILGGWGGGLVGLSSIDNSDASENPTTKYRDFYPDRWYRVRLRVTPKKIEAWLNDDPIIDLETAGKKISLRPGEIDKSIPLGLATYQTSAAYRNIRLRRLP